MQSKRLATQVRLFARNEAPAMAGGTLLQILPTSSEATNIAETTEFSHLSTLTETLTPEELFTLPANDVLYRLYHQEEVKMLP